MIPAIIKFFQGGGPVSDSSLVWNETEKRDTRKNNRD
jgi:hypothetical protein